MPKPPPTHQPAERFGDWMQTYPSCSQFWPLDPRPSEVFIEDIARSLSMTARYLGHLRTFYSTAEHSVYVSQAVAPEHALWGLLHDAAEAYCHDIIRPIKSDLVGYREIEARIMAVICERFGMPLEAPTEVKAADDRIVADERAAVCGKPPVPWSLRAKPLGITIAALGWHEAEALFLTRYHEITAWNSEVDVA